MDWKLPFLKNGRIINSKESISWKPKGTIRKTVPKSIINIIEICDTEKNRVKKGILLFSQQRQLQIQLQNLGLVQKMV